MYKCKKYFSFKNVGIEVKNSVEQGGIHVTKQGMMECNNNMCFPTSYISLLEELQGSLRTKSSPSGMSGSASMSVKQ